MFLFRVTIEVATTAIRPTLWPEQSGWCWFYLFATDAEDASQRARTILETLPFVPTTSQAVVHELDGPRIALLDDSDSHEPKWAEVLEQQKRQMQANARLTGLAFTFIPVGYTRPEADPGLIRFVIDPNAPGSPSATPP
jgi:hypothetical protein